MIQPTYFKCDDKIIKYGDPEYDQTYKDYFAMKKYTNKWTAIYVLNKDNPNYNPLTTLAL